MPKSLRQLFEEARNSGLMESEKLAMKNNLERFIREPGVIKDNSERLDNRGSIIQANKNKFKFNYMPILIAILIALGGGTSFAAQSALPGDALYPVKVNVNEEVQGFLSMSDQAKANWEAVLAARRLNEAEQLAAESKLNATTAAQLETNFEEHANNAEARITKLASVDAKAAADIASNLQISLQAHDNILTDISTSKDGETEVQLKPLTASVKSEAKDASENLIKTEAQVKSGPDVEAAAQGRLTAAQNKIAEVKKFIDNKKDTIGATAAVQAQTQLDAANALIVQGQTQINAKAYGAAFTLFGQAQAKAQAVQLLVAAKADLEHEDESSPTPSVSTSPLPSSSVSPTPSVSASPDSHGRGRSDNSGKLEINVELD